jgi:hypothetical protein
VVSAAPVFALVQRFAVIAGNDHGLGEDAALSFATELDDLIDAIDTNEIGFKLELNCRLSDWVMTYVEDPSMERIQVELAPSSDPLSPFISSMISEWNRPQAQPGGGE